MKGPTVFEGYWREGRITPDGHHDGWWRTGDVASRDRWGRFHHLDRAGDVVRTDAGPVYTLPIEELLLQRVLSDRAARQGSAGPHRQGPQRVLRERCTAEFAENHYENR